MKQHSVTNAAAALCDKLISDPTLNHGERLIVRQLREFVESVRAESRADPFYEDCIRYLAADIAGAAL